MHKIKVEQFEGPLDLLLQLIEQNKLDITQLSLATVTEQYINILYQTRDLITADELADFLLVAAKLLVIKSKALLPYLFSEEEDESQDLENQLKMYREFYLASKKMHKLILKKNFIFSRQRFLAQDIGFQPPRNVKASILARVFQEIIRELEPIFQLPKSVIRKTVNIIEKIEQIRNMLVTEITLNFRSVLKGAKNKTEVIVSFLALLELTKQKIIVVKQENIFEEIIIEKV